MDKIYEYIDRFKQALEKLEEINKHYEDKESQIIKNAKNESKSIINSRLKEYTKNFKEKTEEMQNVQLELLKHTNDKKTDNSIYVENAKKAISAINSINKEIIKYNFDEEINKLKKNIIKVQETQQKLNLKQDKIEEKNTNILSKLSLKINTVKENIKKQENKIESTYVSAELFNEEISRHTNELINIEKSNRENSDKIEKDYNQLNIKLENNSENEKIISKFEDYQDNLIKEFNNKVDKYTKSLNERIKEIETNRKIDSKEEESVEKDFNKKSEILFANKNLENRIAELEKKRNMMQNYNKNQTQKNTFDVNKKLIDENILMREQINEMKEVIDNIREKISNENSNQKSRNDVENYITGKVNNLKISIKENEIKRIDEEIDEMKKTITIIRYEGEKK